MSENSTTSTVPTNSPETFGTAHTTADPAAAENPAAAMSVIDCLELVPARKLDAKRPAVQRLLSAERANLIVFNFAAGQTLPDHKAAHPITVQCLAGTLDFQCGDSTVRLTPGKVIHLPAYVVHAVSCPDTAAADSDNILLLTMLTGS